MSKLAKTIGPFIVAVLLVQLNGGVGSIVGAQQGTTTKPPPPTTSRPPTTATTAPPTTDTDVQPTPPTKEGNGAPVTTIKKKKRKGALPKTGPGDDAGEFRLILFNGGFLLLMVGAIFFAVKRRVERREWWRISSKM